MIQPQLRRSRYKYASSLTECCADVTSWTAMVPFAETEQLIIRGIQDGDVERVRVWLDTRVVALRH
jgi:hypothetical protein